MGHIIIIKKQKVYKGGTLTNICSSSIMELFPILRMKTKNGVGGYEVQETSC